MNKEPRDHSIDHELEARIVALVLGEASDFERDQLMRLIEERPELADFMEAMQSVHGLLEDVGAGETMPHEDDWKLASERRNALLAVMSGQAEPQPPMQLSIKSVEARRSKQRKLLRTIAGIAAVFLVVAVFGSLAMLSRQTAQLASRKAASRVMDSRVDFMVNERSRAATDMLMFERASTNTEGSVAAAIEELDSKHASKSALLGTRDSLGSDLDQPSHFYFQDDVQVLPAKPGFNKAVAGADSAWDDDAETWSRDKSEGGGFGLAVADGTVESTREFNESLPEAQESGRGQPASPQQPPQRGRFESRVENGAAIGSGFELGDVDEMAMADVSKKEAEQRTAEPSEVQMDWMATGGSFDRAGSLADGRLSLELPEAAGVDRSTMLDDRFGTGQGLGMPAISMSGSTSTSTLMRDEQKTRGFVEESAKESLGFPIDQSIAFHDRQFQDAESYREQVPKLFTGPATNQPVDVEIANGQLGGSRASGKASQTQTWSGEARPNLAIPGAAELSKDRSVLYAEIDALPGDKYLKNFAEESKQGEGLPRGGELAAGKPPGAWRYAVPPTSSFSLDFKAGTPITKTIAPEGMAETNALQEPYSTFSLHVSDVSFKLARAALAAGTWPEPEKVRIEEFVNAIDYGDPLPSHHERVACRVEQSVHPFLQQRNLLRVSMRTAAAGRASSTPLRLTLLVDNSGSMERIDRQTTVRRAFELLAQQLQPIDQVSLISFARQPRLLADQVNGSQSHQLVQIIDDLPSEGGTNIEAALRLAFEKAMEHRVEGAQNRIILLTDGAVNLGDADPERLSQMITTMRGAGIAFDAAGISAEGLNDEILEALTRKGDGRYYLLDSIDSADEGFARQIAGALRPSAKNVKVQIEFNPKRVGHYKLLGFEKHLLQKEDFRNDKVDAAEMAAAEAGVAVYQFEAKPDGEGDVGSVSVRFRDLSTGQMIENCWPIPYEEDAPRLDQATPSLRIATSAALLAAKLRGESLGETVDLKTLSNLIAELPERDRSALRVQELQQMIAQARQLSGK